MSSKLSISKLRKKARATAAVDEASEAVESVEHSDPIDAGAEDDDDEPSSNKETGEKRKRKRKRKVAADTEEKEGAPSSKVVADASANVESNSFVNSRTVYIEGLPFTATDSQVSDFFRECGKIFSIRLPKWHDSGRLRGYGHVEFASDDAAQKAFELDGCDFLDSGRYLKIARPMAPRALQQSQVRNVSASELAKLRPPGCKTVFVKNLPYEVDEEAVRSVFQVCGPILSVRLAVWGHTQQLKGFGYVEFKREDSADIAVKKSGVLAINGRPLIVDYEAGAPKGSFKAPMKKSDSK